MVEGLSDMRTFAAAAAADAPAAAALPCRLAARNDAAQPPTRGLAASAGARG